jgi:predicted alpha/beta hydrolase family esterase
MSGYLPAKTYIDATLDGTTTTASTGAIWIGPDRVTRISAIAKYNADAATSQDLVTTNVVYGSDDPRARPDHPDHANADWDDITADITDAAHINASSGEGDGSYALDNINYDAVKIDVTRNTGDGDYKLRVAGRSG